jgi:hypothetical protein
MAATAKDRQSLDAVPGVSNSDDDTHITVLARGSRSNTDDVNHLTHYPPGAPA